MQRATPLDTSLRAYSSGGSRGCVHEANDGPDTAPPPAVDPDGKNRECYMQTLKINMMSGETRERVEHPQNYGFTGHVRKAEYSQQGGQEGEQEEIERCAEHFVQFMGGNRSFPVVQNLDDRRYRLRNFKEGEVAVYDDQQQKVHLERKRIHARSQFKIELRVIKDEEKEDGHGRHKDADRDQQKDKSKPLSTLSMDKDWIGLLRTDDEGKRLTELKLGDRRITETVYAKGQPHLVFDMDGDTELITMTTLAEGRPHLEFSLDNDSGNIGFQNNALEEGKSNLIFELDDKLRKITIATERDELPQLVIELDSMSGNIVIHTENLVKLGDRNADRPVALLDSVDAVGNRIVGDVATKVVAK